MYTITSPCAATIEVKKSKFHSFLVPYESFATKLQQLKSAHPKARHFVTAFRYLNEYKQIVEGSSDDGEPKGTSGKPTLKVLQGHDLINVGIITVRYFGGTLLGAGGLVRAYSDSANLAVANATLIPYEELVEEIMTLSYEQISRCEYLANKYNIEIIDRAFDDGIRYVLRGSKPNLDLLRSELEGN
ncbi:MAG: YigZ family protein [Epsilonproteobacteria bacterium]|nr:YigZ family protein [Campylobacterota bacterium]